MPVSFRYSLELHRVCVMPITGCKLTSSLFHGFQVCSAVNGAPHVNAYRERKQEGMRNEAQTAGLEVTTNPSVMKAIEQSCLSDN